MAGRFVNGGQLAGVAALVWRRGEIVEVVTEGWADLENLSPLRRDTIFRIASMTKPIISVAALMLVEDGRLSLDDPLTRWLPEAAQLCVLRSPDAALDDTVALDRPPTVHDLVTHSAGFSGSLAVGPSLAVTKAMAIATGQTPFITVDPNTLVARVCAVPLIVQPGRHWNYGISTDLLGVVIARAAQTGLGRFLKERVFDPLGMADTGFWVPAEKRSRLAVGYARGADNKLVVHDDPATGHWSKPPVFPAGGGGLVSTLDDYLAFARMLLAGGTIADRRLLARETVAAMTTPQLTPDQARPVIPALDILAGRNFGLGVAIGAEGGAALGSHRRYGWSGVYGTDWFNDPDEGLIGIWHDVFEAIGFYLGMSVLLTVLTTGVVVLLLRSALQPIAALAAASAAVSPRQLTFGAPAEALAIRELRPLALTLSAMIEELRLMFDRQHRFLGDAAHELKTALAIVKSSLQLLLLRPRTVAAPRTATPCSAATGRIGWTRGRAEPNPACSRRRLSVSLRHARIPPPRPRPVVAACRRAGADEAASGAPASGAGRRAQGDR